MGSIFTTTPGNTIKGFGGRVRPIPFYLQFVPGVVVEVVHSTESKNYMGSSTINTIMAVPHIHDKVSVTKATSTSENFRYYPLFRTMNDVPSKGDPVLLCTIGRINYYLGPLNTMENNVTWNDDPSFKPEVVFNQIKNIGNNKITQRGQRGESPNFNKQNKFNRMSKFRKPNLDFGDAIGEVTGDTIIEGRHGNSIRIGSRSDNPYMFLSNKRSFSNDVESLGDGSLITITSDGTLAEHFSGYTINTGNDNEEVLGFTLASDLVVGNETPPNRFMGSLVSSVNNNQDSQDLIYNYGNSQEIGIKNQILIYSDRITLNSKSDDIYLSSKKDIHIGTRRHLTISTNEDFIVDSERTFLGNPTQNNSSRDMEPMVLGTTLLELLKETLSVIKGAQGMCQGAPLPLVGSSPADPISAKIVAIENKIDTILSNKHFIEPNE